MLRNLWRMMRNVNKTRCERSMLISMSSILFLRRRKNIFRKRSKSFRILASKFFGNILFKIFISFSSSTQIERKNSQYDNDSCEQMSERFPPEFDADIDVFSAERPENFVQKARNTGNESLRSGRKMHQQRKTKVSSLHTNGHQEHLWNEVDAGKAENTVGLL